jgi:histidine triad (HIT) family protein
MTDCLFCKIANGEIKGDIVYEDDEVIGFRDINPQAPHHILFIPREHIATLNDLDDAHAALAGKLVLAARQVAKELGVAEDGYRQVMNCNSHGGQTVFHVHLHLLAGRPMGWPPG